MGQILIVVAPPVALGVLLVSLALPTAPLWLAAEAGALPPVDRVVRVTLLEVRASPILPCKADQGILIQDNHRGAGAGGGGRSGEAGDRGVRSVVVLRGELCEALRQENQSAAGRAGGRSAGRS